MPSVESSILLYAHYKWEDTVKVARLTSQYEYTSIIFHIFHVLMDIGYEVLGQCIQLRNNTERGQENIIVELQKPWQQFF